MRTSLQFTVYSLQFSGLKGLLCVALCSLLFSSCLKEEDPITPPDLHGEVETAQIPMGAQYLKQYYFDLGTNQVVSSNFKTEWDLGFECGVDGYHIILNSSKMMFAWNTKSKDFEAITSEQGARWGWDVASGSLDSTAIGEWGEYADRMVVSYKTVYVINRGRNADNSSLGFKKVVFEGLQNGVFTLRFANLDGSDEHTVQVQQNDTHSFTYFSFHEGGKTVNIAPPNTEWDIVFTQYTHIFNESSENTPQPADTLIPYMVTGALLNSYEVVAEREFTKPFADITIEDATNRLFANPARDIIGYNWKFFNFDEVTYIVIPQKVYIIRDTEGYLYKLHFIDFYSTMGEKGFPMFEFQRL